MNVWWVICVSLAAAAVFAALCWYAFRYEPFNFKLSRVSILVKDGQAARNDEGRPGEPVLSILHLSDFHLQKNSKGRKLFKFVTSLKNLKVDFIIITGDLLESDENINYLIRMLSPLSAKYGKYAVLGVHDHYRKSITEFAKNLLKRKRRYRRENDIGLIIKRLGGIGIEVLMNESRKINLGRGGINNIEIIGLDDPIIRKTDIARAFSNIGSPDEPELQKKADYGSTYKYLFKLKKEEIHKINSRGKLRIVLIHTPDAGSIIEVARRKSDIVFSGHTHGGQVRLPLIGAIISGCRIKTKFASGLFYFKTFILYVTRGLGEGRYSQFRFYCQPEASLVRIYKIE